MGRFDEIAAILEGRTCAECDRFRVGDAAGYGDGYCLADVDEGPLEWREVNDADNESCPRWLPVKHERGEL